MKAILGYLIISYLAHKLRQYINPKSNDTRTHERTPLP
jgi:hypothetical protein